MSDECIHGFPDGLCAICNPKPAPEPVAKTRPPARPRTVSQARTVPRTRSNAPTVPAGPPFSALEQRIYHVTHIRNVPGIVAAQAILAGANPEIDISPEDVRLERMEATVGATERTLESYVPFFLSPDATLWHALRTGMAHPRLSAEALSFDASDFVLLVSTLRRVVATDRDFVVTDDNAAGSFTRFATTREDGERMLQRLRGNPDATLEAELLVEGSLPLGSVELIGVQNDKVRSAVRDILAGSDVSPKISVYPPWFQPLV